METITNNITAKNIKNKMQNNEDFILVNTLSKKSFCAKHIPGSINMPVSEIKEYAEKVLPDKSQQLIVYCANSSCTKSVDALKVFEELGYQNVKHFPEGLAGWRKEGYVLSEVDASVKDEC
ncbi:MAG: rhodanese-like domain-containing protein [Bacteroidota bacterium]|nr:rhodanese-like domain-containing protein [Bacteroidota bacterium]